MKKRHSVRRFLRQPLQSSREDEELLIIPIDCIMSSSSNNEIPVEQPKSSSSTPQTTVLHHEDKLSKTWTTMVKMVVAASQKAEKAAAEPLKPTLKELDEFVVNFLRTRVEWSRSVSYLEAKLEGKEKEMETFHNFARAKARLGKRKRQADGNDVTESCEKK